MTDHDRQMLYLGQSTSLSTKCHGLGSCDEVAVVTAAGDEASFPIASSANR